MLAERTYQNLKAMIYGKELIPGERLVERKLCERLGVSRVPLRESLVRLESEGLVRRVHGGPSRVIDFSKSDVVEMYSMRLLIEPFATRLAALNRPDNLLKELNALCDKMTEASKAETWAKLDLTQCEFHYTIVKASGHRTLFQAYESCHIQMGGMLSNLSHLKAGKPPETTARQHQPIVDAIASGDPEVAEQVAYLHVKTSIDAIQQRFGISLTEKQKPLFTQ
jgi:DNA-binding GntR family transcriptional regulator